MIGFKKDMSLFSKILTGQPGLFTVSGQDIKPSLLKSTATKKGWRRFNNQDSIFWISSQK